MVVGFRTTYVFESRSVRGVPHYMIKFVSPPVSSTNKAERHDITEIPLKVALNTIKQTNTPITFNGIHRDWADFVGFHISNACKHVPDFDYCIMIFSLASFNWECQFTGH